ncbi:MAG TPA: TetR/AcrR family transcriptional regulator [Candidatus Binataceae bacterium]|nr:TetR/AcrR family transcriptional regulator [Candidatus Binataceae bacterium]
MARLIKPTGWYSQSETMSEASSRTSILKTARNLMLKYGYAATSVDDICSSAGVTKGSLYHFFETKEELGMVVLNGFYDEGVARVARGPHAEMNDPYQRLLGLFDHLEAIGPELWRDGCLMGNFACELSESSPIIRRRVSEIFEELVNKLAPIFRPIARRRKEADELAEQTLMVIEGAVVMAKAHNDPNRIASGLRFFRRTIEARIQESRRATGKTNRGRASSPL